MFYIKTLLVFINHHSALAYGAIFMISLSESLALVGLIVPGTVIMFGVGAIVATGSLGLKLVLLLAATGAIVGDGISYWLGRHYQEKLRRTWPFSRYPGMLQIGETFFNRHGGKSVLFGRFVGPVRPVIPVVAGMLGMRWQHFGVVNVLSAIGWALVYILPGVFFGASLAVAGAVSTRLAVLIFTLIVAMWGFIWLSRKLVLIEELPVLPRLHDGRIDSLLLLHQTKGQQWVLRLWPTGVKIAGDSKPIFVGTIEKQQKRHLTGLITLARDTGDYDRSLDELKDVLHDRFAMKLNRRTSNEVQVSHEDRRLHWSGSILLVWEKSRAII
jgi:membrane protein DedA with SNARE-associated domain